MPFVLSLSKHERKLPIMFSDKPALRMPTVSFESPSTRLRTGLRTNGWRFEG